MAVDTEQALKAGAMEMFTKLLEHNSHIIRAKAARDIMDLRSVKSLSYILNFDMKMEMGQSRLNACAC